MQFTPYPLAQPIFYFALVLLAFCAISFLSWLLHMVSVKLRFKWTRSWSRLKATTVYASLCLVIGLGSALLGGGASSISKSIEEYRLASFREKLLGQPLSQDHIKFDEDYPAIENLFASVSLQALSSAGRVEEAKSILKIIHASDDTDKIHVDDPRNYILGSLCEAAKNAPSVVNSVAWRRVVTACTPIIFPYHNWEDAKLDVNTNKWLAWLWQAHIEDNDQLASVLAGRYIVGFYDKNKYTRETLTPWKIVREIDRKIKGKTEQYDFENYVLLDFFIVSKQPTTVLYNQDYEQKRDASELALMLISGKARGSVDDRKFKEDALKITELRNNPALGYQDTLGKCIANSEYVAQSQEFLDGFDVYAANSELYKKMIVLTRELVRSKPVKESEEEFEKRAKKVISNKLEPAKADARDAVRVFNSAKVCVQLAAFDQKVKAGLPPIELPQPSEKSTSAKNALAMLAFEKN